MIFQREQHNFVDSELHVDIYELHSSQQKLLVFINLLSARFCFARHFFRRVEPRNVAVRPNTNSCWSSSSIFSTCVCRDLKPINYGVLYEQLRRSNYLCARPFRHPCPCSLWSFLASLLWIQDCKCVLESVRFERDQREHSLPIVSCYFWHLI